MKEALRHLPWPVTLIGTYQEGRHNLMTASWVSQVSFQPPLIMVSVAPERYTYQALIATREFAVSILAPDQAEIAQFCGERSGREVDKVKALNVKVVPPQEIKVPLLADCIANIECRVVAHHPAGDHVIFIGEVVASRVQRPEERPLLMKDWRWGVYQPL